VPVLTRPLAVTLVAAPSAVLPTSMKLLLVRVPPMIRLLPPSPEKRSSTRRLPLLLRPATTVSVPAAASCRAALGSLMLMEWTVIAVLIVTV
jgi:hypothetical protein